MVGYPPKELTDLNEVERILISIARVNKHMFSFSAGTHKSIKGWHSMYYNDVEAVNDVANWIHENAENSDDENNDSIAETAQSRRTPRNQNDSAHTLDHASIDPNITGNFRFPQVGIVLVGPFTKAQRSLVKNRTKISVKKVKKALQWLKENNPLYADYNFTEASIRKPYLVDSQQEVDEENNNVEKVFEIHSVFPDSVEADTSNGGCKNIDDFRQVCAGKNGRRINSA